MASLIDRILEGREILQRTPWPRAVVGAHLWRFAANELAQGRLSEVDRYVNGAMGAARRPA